MRYNLGFRTIAKVTPSAVMFLPRFTANSGSAPAPTPWIWPNDQTAPIRFDSLSVSFERHLANLENGVLFRGDSESSGEGYYVTDGTTEGTYKVSELVKRFDDHGRGITEATFADRFLRVGDRVVFTVLELNDWSRLYSFDLQRPDDLESDLNGDGKASFADFLLLADNFGQRDKSFSEGDLDGDGQVTVRDFQILRREYGVE